jgi:hypothetical protein
MTIRKILLDPTGQPAEIAENDSSEFVVDLEIEDGVPVPVGSVSGVKLTLSDLTTGTVIGLWDHRPVLNANGGTVEEVTEDGATKTRLTVPIPSADNAKQGDGRSEWHLILVEMEWAGGGQRIGREYLFRVVDLLEVP